MQTRSIYMAIVVAMAAASVACGNSMQAVGSSGMSLQQSASQNEANMKAAEVATQEAEAALQSAEEELSGMWQNNQVVVSEPGVGLSKVSEKSLTGLPEKLKAALDKLFAKITLPMDKAKAAIAKARVELAAQLGKLDPNNPAHALVLARLQDALSRLESFESRIASVYKLLADRGQVLLTGVDALIGGLGLGNPLGWIAAYELREVRNVLADFLAKLGSL